MLFVVVELSLCLISCNASLCVLVPLSFALVPFRNLFGDSGPLIVCVCVCLSAMFLSQRFIRFCDSGLSALYPTAAYPLLHSGLSASVTAPYLALRCFAKSSLFKRLVVVFLALPDSHVG